MAYIRLHKYNEALADAHRVTLLQPDWVKVHLIFTHHSLNIQFAIIDPFFSFFKCSHFLFVVNI